MASAGGGTPPTIESSENRTEADANAGGSLPPGGQDMGATEMRAAGTKLRARARRARARRKKAAARQPTRRHQGSPRILGIAARARK